ncbi:replication protein RepA, partial [Shewanella sp. 1180_01]
MVRTENALLPIPVTKNLYSTKHLTISNTTT